jgi:hypothetical protein
LYHIVKNWDIFRRIRDKCPEFWKFKGQNVQNPGIGQPYSLIQYSKLKTSWQSCTPAQIRAALPLVLAIRASDDAAIILPLMDRLAEVLSGLSNVDTLPLLVRQDLYSCCAWALNESLTERPYPYIRIGFRRYYLPLPGYADTSAIEVSMANIHYLAFSHPKAPRPESLYSFLGTILRPRRLGWRLRKALATYDGEDREEYNSLRAQQRAELFKRLTFDQLIPILLYWENMNNAFVKRYEKLYEGADLNAKQLFQNGEGWIATLEDVAESRVHGDFDGVCGTNIHTIWLYLVHKKIKRDEENRLLREQHQAE